MFSFTMLPHALDSRVNEEITLKCVCVCVCVCVCE